MLRQQKSPDWDSNGEHEQVRSKGERAVKTVMDIMARMRANDFFVSRI